jgi:hypothetical protein
MVEGMAREASGIQNTYKRHPTKKAQINICALMMDIITQG